MRKGRIAVLDRIDSKSNPGGDTIQICEIVNFLKKEGFAVDVFNEIVPNLNGYDFAFIFNLTRYREALLNAIVAKHSKVKYIVFPVYWNLNDIRLPVYSLESFLKEQVFKTCKNKIKTYYDLYIRKLDSKSKNIIENYKDLFTSEKLGVEYILNNAFCICPNSIAELKHLKKYYSIKDNINIKVIYNGVKKDLYKRANLDLATRNGLYCVGGIGPRKNQLNLGKALYNSDIEINIIGKTNDFDKGYLQKIKKYEKNLNLLGWKEHDEVINLLSQAKIHIQPSFIETPGLASMEAYVLGCRIIVSDVEPVREYFGDIPIYINPYSLKSISDGINKAMIDKYEIRFDEIKEFNNKFSWENVLKDILCIL